MAITNLPFAVYAATTKHMVEATDRNRETLKKACYKIGAYVLKLWNEYDLNKEFEAGGRLTGPDYDAHAEDMKKAYAKLTELFPTPDAQPEYEDYTCCFVDEAAAAEYAKTLWHDTAVLATAVHWVYFAVFECHISFHEADFFMTDAMGSFHKLGRTQPEPTVVKFDSVDAEKIVAVKDGAEMDLAAAVEAVKGGAKDIVFKVTGLKLA